ncbi:MAG: aminoacyl-histidine dipeptidase [Myxococcota bacterium]|nr:aminoacyl-histidine dipeptidase [Myxococcota bacterium]
MSFVGTLEPTALWNHFDQILAIPRGSGNESKIREHIVGLAEKNGLEFQIDKMGNLLVRKPGTKGHESAPATVLQNHMDMVNEKNSDVDHDFENDPLKPEREGEYLTAVGTTLGADNGVGIAAALAVMEADDLVHGPLELLFTVDEETGLTGAAGIDAGMIQARVLLNLDSEEENVLYVGCAGGGDSNLKVPIKRAPIESGWSAVEVTIKGLKGGHSGCDIHRQRGNATKLLVRALHAASLQGISMRFVSLSGGSAHNAIPREASAIMAIPADSVEGFKKAVETEIAAVQDEFKKADPDITLVMTDQAAVDQTWDNDSSMTILRLLNALPHGVQGMSYDIPDLVETSTNLATLREDEDSFSILMSSRSSTQSALRAVRQRIRAVGEMVGAAVTEGAGYPGWQPNLDSPLLGIVKDIHQRELGIEPTIKAIHAGLECGIIGEKLDGMDMISVGPQIEFPHSPDERVHIESVERFYRLLEAVLAELATK